MRNFNKFNLNSVFYTLCAVVVVFFGTWTILANIIVLSGGNFTDLQSLVFIAVIASMVILGYLRFEHLTGVNKTPVDNDSEAESEVETGSSWTYLLVGAVLSGIFAFEGNYLFFWAITIIYLSIVFWTERHAPALRFREADS